MMKSMMILGLCVAFSACTPPPTKEDRAPVPALVGTWQRIDDAKKITTAKGGEIVAKVDGHEVVAVIKWRAYDATRDAGVSQWHGDMGSPPPLQVVDSLVIAVDGRGVSLAKSQYRSLCSKWIRADGLNPMSFNRQGNKVRLLVDVGDGGEGWTAVYVIDPAAGKLMTHVIAHGPDVHQGIAP